MANMKENGSGGMSRNSGMKILRDEVEEGFE